MRRVFQNPYCCRGRAMQLFEYHSVRYRSKAINGTLTGGRKKVIFLFASLTMPKWSAAPVESCQSMLERSLWGRLGSVLYTFNLLHRMRHRFQLQIHLRRCISSPMRLAEVVQLSSSELSKSPSTCACGVGVYPPSDLTHRESESRYASQKSVLFGLDSTLHWREPASG